MSAKNLAIHIMLSSAAICLQLHHEYRSFAHCLSLSIIGVCTNCVKFVRRQPLSTLLLTSTPTNLYLLPIIILLLWHTDNRDETTSWKDKNPPALSTILNSPANRSNANTHCVFAKSFCYLYVDIELNGDDDDDLWIHKCKLFSPEFQEIS